MSTVTDRFFEAFDTLLAEKSVGLRGFCREVGVNHTAFIKQRDDHTRHIIRPHWLEHIVVKYGVSPRWLLTGGGKMFTK